MSSTVLCWDLNSEQHEVAPCVLWRHWTTACYAVGWKTLHSRIHQLPTYGDHQLPREFRPSVICRLGTRSTVRICRRFAACAVNSRAECWCRFISCQLHSTYLMMSDLILTLDLVPSHWSTVILVKDRERTYVWNGWWMSWLAWG